MKPNGQAFPHKKYGQGCIHVFVSTTRPRMLYMQVYRDQFISFFFALAFYSRVLGPTEWCARASFPHLCVCVCMCVCVCICVCVCSVCVSVISVVLFIAQGNSCVLGAAEFHSLRPLRDFLRLAQASESIKHYVPTTVIHYENN